MRTSRIDAFAGRRPRRWDWVFVLAAGSLLAACGAGRGPEAGAGPAAREAALPALPLGAADQPQRAASREYDNILYGKEYFAKSTPGADVSEHRLVLYGPGSEKGAWGMYQWSGFTGGLRPNALTADLSLEPGREYWLLLSDYTAGRWEVHGPLTAETHTYIYPPQRQYVSPAGNTYAVVLVDRQHTALLNQLNLKADRDIDPPAPPGGLRVDNIMSHSADLHWTPNPDADVLGYRLYRGPDPAFEPGEAGVEIVDADIEFLAHDYALTELAPDTLYHYKLSAFDVAFNESRLSAACTFKTLPNLPPSPAFSWSPGFVQVDREVVFDPTGTTDAGDDLSRETFSWDFENDGVVDVQTTGPELMPHTYSQRRTYDCRLVVSDGSFDAELVQAVQVSFRYDYYNYGEAGGLPATLVSATTDPPTGRIAVLVNAPEGFGAYLYAGGQWEWLPVTGLPEGIPADVCLGQDSLGVLMLEGNDWTVYDYSGGAFTPSFSGSIPAPVLARASVAASASGRYSVEMVAAPEPPVGQEADFTLFCYHQTAGGGGSGGSIGPFGPGNMYPSDIQRNDSSTFVSIVNGSIKVLEVTDSTSGITDQQAMAEASVIALAESPAAPGELTWIAAAPDGSLVWGDNFGAPNGAGQSIFLAEPVDSFLGLRSLGDNAAEFYWTAIDALNVSHLQGYKSSSAELFGLGSGYGLASFGSGGALVDGAQSGIYFAVAEERDGEVTGYFVDSGSLLRREEIYEPSGTSAVMGYSYPVIFPDGSLSVFCEQPFPTAIRAQAPALDQPFVKDACGEDNYIIPAAACATGNGGEFFIGSVTERSDIVVTRFAAGATTGEEQLVAPQAQLPALWRSPATGKVLLAYASGFNSEDISCREWDGAAWSGEQLVYDGSALVMQIALRPRPDGGWGIAFGLDTDQLWLAESAGSGWDPPVLLSGQILNDYCGVGLGYAPDGDCAVAIERGIPQALSLGVRPAGGSDFEWTVLNAATNGYVRETALFYEGGADPVVFYYLHRQFSDESGIYVYEKIDGEWNLAQFDFLYYESPLGTAVDPQGNIVISGIAGWPADAVYTVIWR